MISLVAFLGNYGREYEQTRHNAAWLFADSLPFASLFDWQQKFKGLYASADAGRLSAAAESYGLSAPPRAETEGRCIRFLKPQTYMNLSGECVGEAARFYKIPPQEILVVHDELELAAGTVSLKWSGGLGGHNGLRSVKSALGTADFWRIRFGIGRPQYKDVAGYVLSDFTFDEKILLSAAFAAVSGLLVSVLLAPPENSLKYWAKKTIAQAG